MIIRPPCLCADSRFQCNRKLGLSLMRYPFLKLRASCLLRSLSALSPLNDLLNLCAMSRALVDASSHGRFSLSSVPAQWLDLCFDELTLRLWVISFFFFWIVLDLEIPVPDCSWVYRSSDYPFHCPNETFSNEWWHNLRYQHAIKLQNTFVRL